jgi:GAF domain-containing protein
MVTPDDTQGAGSAELFQLLLSTDTLDGFLQELAVLAAVRVDDQLSCGITSRVDHRPVTVAASDQFAMALDEQQYMLDHGPCLTAMTTGQRVEIPNLAAELERWGSYGTHALAHGLGAALSVPMIAIGKTWGALNLYSPTPETFTALDRDRAEDLAAQAAGALAVAARIAEKTQLSEHLKAALESRAVIDQALGIVMGAQHCNADAAFDVLRNASQHRNEKLRDIAARIVATTSHGPRPAPGG